jgi:hypothetical protein
MHSDEQVRQVTRVATPSLDQLAAVRRAQTADVARPVVTFEHAFRFCKQTLGWTTVRPRHPAAADRWTCLVASACWQVWFARPLLGASRLPWGASSTRPLAHARPGPTLLHANIGPAGHTRPRTSAPRKIARTSPGSFGPRPHSTMKWHGARPRAPLDLTKLVQTSTFKPTLTLSCND